MLHVPLVYHKVCWLEWSTATGTTTWYGDNGGAGGGAQQMGIRGYIEA